MLYAELEAIDAYTAEARAARILDGLGFDSEDLSRPVGEFSGGWRIRLNLAQTLMCRSDLLLLDEPTNHLDLDATLWLEHWLKHRDGTTLVISHDRDFLDRVATDVVHLEGGDARSYRGNYSSFERQRADTLALRQSMYEKQQARVREIRAFVDRFRYKASKARQAQSRLKQLERLKQSAPAHADSPYRFAFPSPGKMSTPLVQFEDAALGYPGAAPVLADARLRLAPGDRLGLLGRNGAGKTTLLRSIAGELPLLAGEEMRGRYAGGRLLRSAHGGDAQSGPKRDAASRGAAPGRHRAGDAHLSRRLGFPGRHGISPQRVAVGRGEGTARARGGGLAPARPAAPRRAHQSPRPRHAPRPDDGPAGLRGRAGARLARPAPHREQRGGIHAGRRGGACAPGTGPWTSTGTGCWGAMRGLGVSARTPARGPTPR